MSSDEQTFVPRYYEIEQCLRSRIAELEPDAPLPSDAQLCEEFAVSRMTARNAVQRLVHDGLVYRMPGSRDVRRRPRCPPVCDQPHELHRRDAPQGARPELPRDRMHTTAGDGRRDAAPPARPRRARVVALHRLRLADGGAGRARAQPSSGDAAPAVLAADLEAGSLHVTLADAGLYPTSGGRRSARNLPTKDESGLLAVTEGWPLLVECRTILDQHRSCRSS